MTDQTNALLSDAVIPPFHLIEAQHVQPAIRELLLQTKQGFEELENNLQPTWADLMVPQETVDDRLGRAWGAVGHLLAVRNSETMRDAHANCQPQVVELSTRMSQSVAIYEGMVAMRDSADFDTLPLYQQRLLHKGIRDAQLAGVALKGAAKERFGQVQMRLAELSTKFSNNVLDATKAWSLYLYNEEDVDGLTSTSRAVAAQAARNKHPDATPKAGPWCITLDAPSALPFFKHSKRRDLREVVYRAYIARAGDGQWDNSRHIDEILALRKEKATLLGYDNYAAMSVTRKMAGNVGAVSELLEELLSASRSAAEREHDELLQFASQHPELGDIGDGLKHWDVSYWAERLRERRYGVDEEALRPFFPLPRVLEGLFNIANRLFGITIVAADGQAPVWHDDVRFFHVHDKEDGEQIASFYLDPYSRPHEKRGGAWMDECVGRSSAFGEPRLPIAYLVCNSTPPVDNRPSLMGFREVETLFHEFGHGLQHMLTRVDDGLASGIRNVEWDAVELPSQFMENWCYDELTFEALSGHWQSDASVPEGTLDKLRAARTFRAASTMLRQLSFGMTDLALHSDYVPGRGQSVFDVQAAIYERTSLLPLLPENRFLCGFTHIFAGGYAAGYYSYKWAEVLSADAFGAFEDVGLDDEQAISRTGRQFRETVLALGGSQHPLEVFQTFRGRSPTTDALLRHCGLSQADEGAQP